MIYNVVNIEPKAVCDLGFFNISRRKNQIQIVQRIDDQRLNRLFLICSEAQGADGPEKLARLRILKSKLVDDDQVPFTQSFRQCRTQCTTAHFLWHLVRPVAWLRSMN